MASRGVLLVAGMAITLLASGACAGLKSAELHVDPPADGSTPPGGDDIVILPDGGKVKKDGGVIPPDETAPPVDFECDHDEWTKTTKTRPECEARSVRLVENNFALQVSGVSIARTPAGRIGISYNSEESTEQGKFHLAHFMPTSAASDPPVVVVRPTNDYFHDGFMSRLVGSAPDTLNALTYDVSDIDQVGTVNLSKLVDGKAPMTEKDLALDAVPRPSEIGFAMAGNGTAYAVVRMPTGASTAKLVARQKAVGAAWSALPDIPDLDTGLIPKDAPGVGSSWLFVDSSDQLHLLFHQNQVMQHSTPRYHTLAGTKWSYRKTIDNNVLDGLCGFNPRIATFGTKKYALFFFRKALQGNPASADLRLATWMTEEDKPQIEIIDQQIPSEDPLQPHYAAAMAIDTYGLVHLAIIRPSSGSHADLEYRRQERIEGGGTKWLSDIVDPEVFSSDGTSFALVDMIVDEHARPHIAYRSGKDDKIHYATRYDR